MRCHVVLRVAAWIISIFIGYGCATLNSDQGQLAVAKLATGEAASDTGEGFLIVAPDRGFLGNEEIADIVTPLAKRFRVESVTVTDDRTPFALTRVIEKLVSHGAKRITVIPFLVTPNDAVLTLVKSLLADFNRLPWTNGQPQVLISLERTFGESYFAVEALADLLKTIENPASTRVIVVSTGASNGVAVQAIEGDLQRIADQSVIERAIRRLEARGAKSITIVRVFGLAASFRSEVERMIGADVESNAVTQVSPHSSNNHHVANAHSGHGHGHHHGAAVQVPGRIRSSAVLSTTGGLEAHPYFAEALLARVAEKSKRPEDETIILVAHGSGEDRENDHWLKLLETLSNQMRANGASTFRSLKTATWREDWPGKREASIERVRNWVAEANLNGGRAIVIPARTNAEGPEREFLKGLDFELGSGFAPHARFAQWVEEQIQTAPLD